MRGYAIAPFAKRKGREQAKPKEPTTKRGMHGEGPGGRSQPTTASLTPPHSNANSKSSAKRQRPSFRRKPALQRTERPSRGEGQRETPANWPRIHHRRGHAIAPFAKRKGREQAKRCERGMHGVGPGGRSQPSTASLTPSAVEPQFEIIGEAPAVRHSGESRNPEGPTGGSTPQPAPGSSTSATTESANTTTSPPAPSGKSSKTTSPLY